MREGFKETFQPLIASQDAVKASIDKEQNAMIKQLQENQLAFTEGLDKNRLPITKSSDPLQGIEPKTIEEELEEEPKKKTFPDDKDIYLTKGRDLNRLIGEEIF